MNHDTQRELRELYMTFCASDSTNDDCIFTVRDFIQNHIIGYSYDSFAVADVVNYDLQNVSQIHLIDKNLKDYDAKYQKIDPMVSFGKQMLFNNTLGLKLIDSEDVINNSYDIKTRKETCRKIIEVYSHLDFIKPNLITMPALLYMEKGIIRVSWHTFMKESRFPFHPYEKQRAKQYLPIILGLLNARIAQEANFKKLLKISDKYLLDEKNGLNVREFRLLVHSYIILNTKHGIDNFTDVNLAKCYGVKGKDYISSLMSSLAYKINKGTVSSNNYAFITYVISHLDDYL